MDVIRRALSSAEVTPSEIAYVNAHGTGTAKNDEAEFLSLHTIFDGTDVSVSSTKSMTGHCLGAAGAVEAVFTVKAVSEDILPPTIGYSEEDKVTLKEKAGDLDFVANDSRKKEIPMAMSNSFAFGGTNASIIFAKEAKQHEEAPKEKLYITGFGQVLSAKEDPSAKVATVALDMKDFTDRGVKLGVFRKLDKFSQLQLVSGIDALKSADVTVSEENERRIGTIIGTSAGPVTEVSNFYEHSKINGENVLGEGSSTIVLETADSAKRRGAHTYAEVAGYACTHSAGKADYTEAQAMKDAISKALAKAGYQASDIDSVYAVISNVLKECE